MSVCQKANILLASVLYSYQLCSLGCLQAKDGFIKMAKQKVTKQIFSLQYWFPANVQQRHFGIFIHEENPFPAVIQEFKLRRNIKTCLSFF